MHGNVFTLLVHVCTLTGCIIGWSPTAKPFLLLGGRTLSIPDFGRLPRSVGLEFVAADTEQLERLAPSALRVALAHHLAAALRKRGSPNAPRGHQPVLRVRAQRRVFSLLQQTHHHSVPIFLSLLLRHAPNHHCGRPSVSTTSLLGSLRLAGSMMLSACAFNASRSIAAESGELVTSDAVWMRTRSDPRLFGSTFSNVAHMLRRGISFRSRTYLGEPNVWLPPGRIALELLQARLAPLDVHLTHPRDSDYRRVIYPPLTWHARGGPRGSGICAQWRSGRWMFSGRSRHRISFLRSSFRWTRRGRRRVAQLVKCQPR